LLREGLRYLSSSGRNVIGGKFSQIQNLHSPLVDLINLAKYIRRIYHHATQQDIPIRWFGNTVRNPGDSPRDDLIPLNAKKVDNPRHYLAQRPMSYLTRTSSNEHSLVFWGKPLHSSSDLWRGGVLLSADSTFSFAHEVKLPIDATKLVTAPHHGSDSNAEAYVPILQSGFFPLEHRMVFVRSGERKSSWPGQAYLQLETEKACTQCRGEPTTKTNPVYMKRKNSKWYFLGCKRLCVCRPNTEWKNKG